MDVYTAGFAEGVSGCMARRRRSYTLGFKVRVIAVHRGVWSRLGKEKGRREVHEIVAHKVGVPVDTLRKWVSPATASRLIASLEGGEKGEKGVGATARKLPRSRDAKLVAVEGKLVS